MLAKIHTLLYGICIQVYYYTHCILPVAENRIDSLGILSAAVSATTQIRLVFPVKLAAWRNEELKECSLTCAPERNSLRAVRLSDIMSVKPWTSGSILGSITWGGMYCVYCVYA